MLKQKATMLPRKKVRIHIKILTEPEGPDLRQRFSAMSKVYDTAGIDVQHASTETLRNVETLNDLDIGGRDGSDNIPACEGIVTDDQNRLAEFRDNVPDGEIVIYICRYLTNGNKGCATHPEGKPMAVITAGSSLYTMAHEVVHILGKKGHPKKLDGSRLMNVTGTSSTTESDPLPTLTRNEIKKIRSSPLLR
jgi:hypothetical protein